MDRLFQAVLNQLFMKDLIIQTIQILAIRMADQAGRVIGYAIKHGGLLTEISIIY